jgi:hypothetical protein
MVRVHSDGVGGRRVIRWACSRHSPAPQQAQQAIAIVVALAVVLAHSKQFMVGSSWWNGFLLSQSHSDRAVSSWPTVIRATNYPEVPTTAAVDAGSPESR